MPRKVNMHRFNGFGLGVYGGRKLENGDIEMANGQIYSIKLENMRDTVAEVVLKIEGEIVGTFLLYPHYKIEIERPVDLSRKFTFYKLNKLPGSKSRTVRYSSCHYSNTTNGLIEAIFTPTLPNTPHRTRFTQDPDSTYHNNTDGITAFTAPSHQKFSRYHRYIFDTPNKTALDIKLVGEYDMDYFYPIHTHPNEYPSYEYPYYKHPTHAHPYYEHPTQAHQYIWYDNPKPLYKPCNEPLYESLYDDEPPYVKPHQECTHCCRCRCKCRY